LLKGVVLDEIAGPVAADFLVSEYAWVRIGPAKQTSTNTFNRHVSALFSCSYDGKELLEN
jgi:hypothetical protein